MHSQPMCEYVTDPSPSSHTRNFPSHTHTSLVSTDTQFTTFTSPDSSYIACIIYVKSPPLPSGLHIFGRSHKTLSSLDNPANTDLESRYSNNELMGHLYTHN